MTLKIKHDVPQGSSILGLLIFLVLVCNLPLDARDSNAANCWGIAHSNNWDITHLNLSQCWFVGKAALQWDAFCGTTPRGLEDSGSHAVPTPTCQVFGGRHVSKVCLCHSLFSSSRSPRYFRVFLVISSHLFCAHSKHFALVAERVFSLVIK